LIGLIVGGAALLLVIVGIMAKRSAAPASQRVCGGCRRVMLPVWTKCLFCGWAPGARLEFILGPMANQTLQLTDDVPGDGNYELADLGSTNGVYVNGHKVPKKTLEPGDIIRVGNTEAVFKRD